MPHQINIRIPSAVALDQLDPTKFQKSTEKAGEGKITVLTYNDKPGKTGLAKLGQKIVNFFSGVKNARESITAMKAWRSMGVDTNTVIVGTKSPRFNTNLIPEMAKQLDKAQKNAGQNLHEETTPDNKFSFTLTRTSSQS